MMDALAGWLKQLIAVVLLASLVDLLLPNRTMQRYVRLVAGLFVLLAILTPVMQGLRGDFGDRILRGLERIVHHPEGAAAEMARIETEAETLRRRHERQAAELAAARLTAAIREAVEQSLGRRVEQVDLETDTGTDGVADVAAVHLVLAAASGSGAADGTATRPIADVAPVAPVTVDIPPILADAADGDRGIRAGPEAGAEAEAEAGGGERYGGTGAGVPAAEAGAAPSADEPAAAERARADPQTASRVAALLAGRFGIPADRVLVWERRAPHTAEPS